MSTPFLIADAAEVAIMSPLAEAAFGSYDLQVPEGIDIEDIHDFEAPGNELGYVARLSPQRATGIARRFIRADVSVVAKDDTDPDVIPESDVDRVLSEAESRVESEFFLESVITKAGLGAWKPYEHFRVGDLVNVRIFDIWVKLPVTRIEPIISEGDVVDWRVHVGGQLLSDDQAREVENATIQKELIQDRRDLAGIDAKATKAVKDAESAQNTADTAESKAEAAQGTADTAKEGVDDLTGSLAGPGATQATVDQQMQDLADQLAAQGEEAPPGLIPAYMHANNERWRMQEEINEATDAALIAHGAAIEANEKAIKSLMRGVAGFMHVPTDAGSWSDDRIEVTRSGGTVAVTALDRWRGTVAFSGSHTGQDGVVTPVIRGSTVPDSGGREYSFPSSGQSIVHYLVNPGVVEEREIANLPVQTLANREWVTVLAWDVPEDTDLMVVAKWVWVAKTYGGDYWGRIVVNGVDVTDAYTSASAPLFGHGRRVAQVSTQWVEAKSGDVVEVQSQAGHGNSTNRRVDSVRANITTVTDEA